MFHAHFKNKVAIFLNAHGLLQPAILSRYSFIPGSTRVATTYKGLATYIENLFFLLQKTLTATCQSSTWDNICFANSSYYSSGSRY